MAVIRVYDMRNKDDVSLGFTKFDERTVSLQQFKWNRQEIYGKDITFVFKYCYIE